MLVPPVGQSEAPRLHWGYWHLKEKKQSIGASLLEKKPSPDEPRYQFHLAWKFRVPISTWAEDLSPFHSDPDSICWLANWAIFSSSLGSIPSTSRSRNWWYFRPRFSRTKLCSCDEFEMFGPRPYFVGPYIGSIVCCLNLAKMRRTLGSVCCELVLLSSTEK